MDRNEKIQLTQDVFRAMGSLSDYVDNGNRGMVSSSTIINYLTLSAYTHLDGDTTADFLMTVILFDLLTSSRTSYTAMRSVFPHFMRDIQK